MNDKFFDLKKEKQDRIISAAMKAFALNGFAHASTDDIVRDAGISKGLLFHYFGSKVGLYAFLYDYSFRFMAIEMQTYVSGESTDYFQLIDEILTARLDAMRQFLYVELFLERAAEEDDTEALDAVKEHKQDLERQISAILERGDITRFTAGADYVLTGRMIDYTLRGLMNEQIRQGTFTAEHYGTEARRYLAMLRRLSYN